MKWTACHEEREKKREREFWSRVRIHQEQVVAHSDPRKQELRSLVDAPFVGLRAYSLPNRISKASWSLEPRVCPPTRLLNNSRTFVQPVTFSSHELDTSRYSLCIKGEGTTDTILAEDQHHVLFTDWFLLLVLLVLLLM